MQLLLNPAPSKPEISAKCRDSCMKPPRHMVHSVWQRSHTQSGYASQQTTMNEMSHSPSLPEFHSSARGSSTIHSTPGPSPVPSAWATTPSSAALRTRDISRSRGILRGTISFSINTSCTGPGPRRRGPLSAEQRKRTALMRKMGACVNSRRKKVSISRHLSCSPSQWILSGRPSCSPCDPSGESQCQPSHQHSPLRSQVVTSEMDRGHDTAS